MSVALFLVPWVLVGIGILFVAYSGGPGAARANYLTKGGRGFIVAMTLLYVATGVAVPALVIAKGEQKAGGTAGLRSDELVNAQVEEGKLLFQQTCKSCHSLAAVNANGVTGPNLDNVGKVTPERITAAIENGGTENGARMPKGLLVGEDAADVAAYVTAVAQR
ncbi:MAG: c-type cytochrome [Thermoleophilaceae bacterium]|nr:c-type cytochrome [Thermoleophilaceae bacterium]